MSKLPPEVQEVIDAISQNPKLQGASLDVRETAPDLWEIVAVARLCVACARPIGVPAEEHLVHEGGKDSKITIMPHACRECARAMAEGFHAADNAN